MNMNLDRVPREGVIDDGKTRYKLIRCIGRGGSSLIYEAKAINSEDEEYVRTYLVKELYPYTKKNLFFRDQDTGKIYAIDETAKQMLERYKERMKTEAERAALISENIDAYVQPPIQNEGIFIDQKSQNVYIIYDKKTGMTLLEFLESNEFINLSYQERCKKFILPFLFQLYEALKILHINGYCHGDIAPDNLFINNKGQIEGVSKDLFLIDFNSCFLIENQPKDWIYSYKEGFSPVELCNYEGRKLGPSVDTYSFIAVFFYMLTKKIPGGNIWRDLRKIEKNFSSPVWEQIRKIFYKGLKSNPKNRYQDFSETGQLLQDLKELNNRLNLRGGVTKAYLWEKVKMIHEEKDWNYNPILLPPTKEGIELSKFIQEDRQDNIVIIGDAGIGKSSLVKAYLKKYSNYYSDNPCCRIPLIIRFNQYNRYKRDAFEHKNQVRQNLGVKQEFLILLNLIIQTYELKEENQIDDQIIKEGLLREFCKKPVNGKKEYIIVLEDFHSLDFSIRNWVKKEFQSAVDDWKNVSFIITERTEEMPLSSIDKALHLQLLSMDQVLSYMEAVLPQNSVDQEQSILKSLRSNHIQQFLRIPQFIVLYSSFLKQNWEEKQLPQTAAQLLSEYFFGEVRLQLSRNEREGYFASDDGGIRIVGEQVISYEFITIMIRFLLPVLAFEMEKTPQKALTSQQFRMVIRKFMPLVPIEENQGIYQEEDWENYLDCIGMEQRKQYNTVWREFSSQWDRLISIFGKERAQKDYEETVEMIFLDCMKILVMEQNQYVFFHDSYQEFFCAYYYYQKLNYWETMGKSMLEEDWEIAPSENVKKYLGELLLVVPDLKTVYRTCEKASVCGILAKACYYNFKNNGEIWLEKERKWVEKQQELGDPYAYYFLALLEKWAGDKARKEKNYEEAKKREEIEVKFMKQAADNGIGEAYYYVGIYYQQGNGDLQDYDLARKYFYRAMESGNNLAIVKLAGVLEQYFHDPLGAIYYYWKGADHNLPQAYTSLARLFEEQNIISGNPKVQEEYLKKGAMQMDSRSICDLADFYFKQKNEREAIRWYQVGVQLNNNRAICSYGTCLENGIGIEKNEEEAWKYYEKAEKAGKGLNPKLILCKAICYIWGKGVPKDMEQAKQLLKQGLEFLENKNTELPKREMQLKEVFVQLLGQMEQNNVLIRRNYIEIEDYIEAVKQDQ